jgi:hypothetical protein
MASSLPNLLSQDNTGLTAKEIGVWNTRLEDILPDSPLTTIEPFIVAEDIPAPQSVPIARFIALSPQEVAAIADAESNGSTTQPKIVFLRDTAPLLIKLLAGAALYTAPDDPEPHLISFGHLWHFVNYGSFLTFAEAEHWLRPLTESGTVPNLTDLLLRPGSERIDSVVEECPPSVLAPAIVETIREIMRKFAPGIEGPGLMTLGPDSAEPGKQLIAFFSSDRSLSSNAGFQQTRAALSWYLPPYCTMAVFPNI